MHMTTSVLFSNVLFCIINDYTVVSRKGTYPQRVLPYITVRLPGIIHEGNNYLSCDTFMWFILLQFYTFPGQTCYQWLH